MKKLTRCILLLSIWFIAYSPFNILSQSLGLDWVATFGSTLGDHVNAIDLDRFGGIYYTGSFTATVDFDPDTGVYNLSGPNNTLFISKLDSVGKFQWAITTGSEGAGYDIVLDHQANVYVAGYFKGFQDFDPGPNVAQLQGGSSINGFIAKYDINGNYLWAKMIGNSFNLNAARSIAIDSSNNVYLTGRFSGNTDFDPDTSSYFLQSKGGTDVYLLKLDSIGNFQWANQIGGARRDEGYNLIHSNNYIYTIGSFEDSAEVIHTSGSVKLSSNGDLDCYVAKFDLQGNLIWVETFGGYGYDYPRAIATDKQENIIVNGTFRGPVDFDPGPSVYNLDSGYVFTLKLDSGGNFIWANRIQSNFATTTTFGVATDSADNIYNVGGFTGIADFDPGVGAYPLQSQTGHLFLQKLSPNGQLIYAIKQNRTNFYIETRNAIVVDDFDNIHMIGDFYDTADFDPDTSTAIRIASSQNWSDIFVQKLNQNNILTSSFDNKKLEMLSEAKLYPNPNKGGFTVLFNSIDPNREMILYTVSGEIIERRSSSSDEVKFKLDLKSGIYFLKIKTNSDYEVIKVVIQ